jgi:hypothetical protein
VSRDIFDAVTKEKSDARLLTIQAAAVDDLRSTLAMTDKPAAEIFYEKKTGAALKNAAAPDSGFKTPSPEVTQDDVDSSRHGGRRRGMCSAAPAKPPRR